MQVLQGWSASTSEQPVHAYHSYAVPGMMQQQQPYMLPRNPVCYGSPAAQPYMAPQFPCQPSSSAQQRYQHQQNAPQDPLASGFASPRMFMPSAGSIGRPSSPPQLQRPVQQPASPSRLEAVMSRAGWGSSMGPASRNMADMQSCNGSAMGGLGYGSKGMGISAVLAVPTPFCYPEAQYQKHTMYGSQAGRKDDAGMHCMEMQFGDAGCHGVQFGRPAMPGGGLGFYTV